MKCFMKQTFASFISLIFLSLSRNFAAGSCFIAVPASTLVRDLSRRRVLSRDEFITTSFLILSSTFSSFTSSFISTSVPFLGSLSPRRKALNFEFHFVMANLFLPWAVIFCTNWLFEISSFQGIIHKFDASRLFDFALSFFEAFDLFFSVVVLANFELGTEMK